MARHFQRISTTDFVTEINFSTMISFSYSKN